MTNIIDGKAIANTILDEIQTSIGYLPKSSRPGLAVIQIGDKQESSIYITKKSDACKKVGIKSFIHKLSINTNNEEVCELINKLNKDNTVHGILVQLPMPEQLDEETILDKISYLKDVDGFNPLNIGNLALNNRLPDFISCTPRGCLELLLRENIKIEGKHVVIIGKSNIVGLPMALLMMKHDATVTICHSKTENIKEITKQADILISACGQSEMIKSNWVKDGVVIIDVGINTKPDLSKKSGYKIVGDVDFEDVKHKASKITPVPGGVGPMTVAMLLLNTLYSFNNFNMK